MIKKKFARFGLLTGVVAVVLAATPAKAENTNYKPYRDYSKANWTGLYVGAVGGGIWSDFNSGGSDASFTGGADIGMNWQMGPWVMGAEGDFSWFDNHTGSNGAKYSQDWMSTMRGRFGYAYDRFLPYVTAGLGLTNTRYKLAGFGTREDVEPGLAIGGGIDTRLMDGWFGRIEYLHVDVPRDSESFGGTTVSGKSGNDMVRIALNYKF